VHKIWVITSKEWAEVFKNRFVLFTIAFLTAGIAGIFGAFINKVAPIR